MFALPGPDQAVSDSHWPKVDGPDPSWLWPAGLGGARAATWVTGKMKRQPARSTLTYMSVAGVAIPPLITGNSTPAQSATQHAQRPQKPSPLLQVGFSPTALL